MHPLPCFFALLLLLLLFANAHSENLIEQVILPVDQPFDNNNNNNNTLTRSLYTIETEIIAAEYTYLMELRVKTSGDEIKTYAIPDTGSDLIWLNANDCVGDACHCSSSSKTKTTTTDQPNCIKKPNPDQLITCKDQKFCKVLERLKIKTCSSSGQCGYDVKFPDGLSTHGMLGTGEFSFPNINSKEKDFEERITFGVSTESVAEGHFAQKSVGVVGLGFGTLSLIKQLPGTPIDRNRKFSYCLPNRESSSRNPKSKIKFGNEVATSAKFSTDLLPMEEGDPCQDRYCVHLAAISVDDRKDKIPVSETNKVMVIDSGTTFTYLVDGLFDDFLKKVRNVIGDQHEPKKMKPYANCFEKSVAEKLKSVSFEFGGSGTTKIELKRDNFFDPYPAPDNTYLCLTVADGDKKENNHRRPPHKKDFHRNILGNRAQMGFLVAFDLPENEDESKKKVVSFVKNCGEEEKLE